MSIFLIWLPLWLENLSVWAAQPQSPGQRSQWAGRKWVTYPFSPTHLGMVPCFFKMGITQMGMVPVVI
jgi:hypothetical protein